jgi:hypothetical protein
MQDEQIFALDKLMSETRRLACEYYRTTGTTLPVSNELARYDVCRLLSFSVADGNSGIDAVGHGPWEGKNIQIKARVLFKDDLHSYRIGQVNPDGNWHSVMLVLMNKAYEPFQIYEMPKEILLTTLTEKPQNPNRTKRGLLSVAKFKALATKVWDVAD